MHKLLTEATLITLSCISVTTQAQVIDPPYTIERAINTIKINADASSEETSELTTLINTQQVANRGSDDQLTFSAETESIKVVEAYTLLPDGKRIDVSKNNIHIKDLSGGRISDAKNGQLRYQYTYTQELKAEDSEISYEDYADHLHRKSGMK